MYIVCCPACTLPTTIEVETGRQLPAPTPGEHVEHLPKSVEALYEQARLGARIGAYNACVMVCRVLLMHVAVEREAKAGNGFVSYIDYLIEHQDITPSMRPLARYVRDIGTTANHTVEILTEQDADRTLHLTSALLKQVYEYPKHLPDQDEGSVKT